MPAINSLSTATIAGVALHSGNASSFPLPIKYVVNRPEVLLRDKTADNFYCHEMAYSAHIRRGKSSNRSCGKLEELVYKPRNPLEFVAEYVWRLPIFNAVRNLKKNIQDSLTID